MLTPKQQKGFYSSMILCGFTGILTFVLMIDDARHVCELLKNGTHTTGVVIEMKRDHPIVEFTDSIGNKHRKFLAISPNNCHVDQRLPLIYLRDAPEHPSFDQFFCIWAGVMIFGGLTFLMVFEMYMLCVAIQIRIRINREFEQSIRAWSQFFGRDLQIPLD